MIESDGVLHLLFPLTNVLTLALPIALVAHYVLQILISIDVFAAYNIRSIGNYLFGQTNFTGNFNGKRTTRVAHLKLKERLHQVAVV
ncbi:hypothetical protein SDC9_157574 [bioreactor metagenome]|uniref:Uncharacterized protein n=1 Tax=bioreactor metagenome TaxID=1076179 RepID=A0A645FAB8_9ZZZZ